MKKLVLFLMVVLMGVFPTVNSYAECDVQENTRGDTSDDALYLNRTDWAGPAKVEELEGVNEKSYYLKCDTNWRTTKSCANGTLIFVTQPAYIGDSFRGLTTIESGSIIQCKAGKMGDVKLLDAIVNDEWFKKGTIDDLPQCEKNAPKYTINVNGKTVHCARKEKRGDNEYCIGTKSGDICIESGNGKSAEKPKEAEQKKEAKPIEENNEPKENCDTSQGYEYNPVSKKCVRTEAGKPEEKKEEPKKEEPKKAAPAKRKEAPKAKQKSGKAIFMDDCAEARGALDQNETTCTLTDETITDIDALSKAIETYNQKFGKAEGKCQSLTYEGAKMWSTACKAEDEFVGTWLIYMPNITCENGTFNDKTGKCDTTNAAAEEPAKAENTPATNGSEEASAEEAAPAATTGEDNSNDEWAALHNDAKRIVDAYNKQKTALENEQK